MGTAVVRLQRIQAKDRRKDRRYPIRAELEYKLLRHGKAVETGNGRIVNASSGGILFEGPPGLPVGQQIELEIDWPARLNDVIPLKVCVQGRTVRSRGRHTAVAIRKYVFRTRRSLEICRQS